MLASTVKAEVGVADDKDNRLLDKILSSCNDLSSRLVWN